MSWAAIDVTSAVMRTHDFAGRFAELLRQEFLYSRSVFEDWAFRVRLLDGVLQGLDALVKHSDGETGANIRGLVWIGRRFSASIADSIGSAYAIAAESESRHRVSAGAQGLRAAFESCPRTLREPIVFRGITLDANAFQRIRQVLDTACEAANQMTADLNIGNPVPTAADLERPVPLPPGWESRSVLDVARRELHFSLQAMQLLDIYLKTRHLFLAFEYHRALSPPAWQREVLASVLDLFDQAKRCFEPGSEDDVVARCRRSLDGLYERLVRCDATPVAATSKGSVYAAFTPY